MEWFTGGVGNAIAACRQNKSLFVVYVYDDTATSKTTDEAWESPQVVGVMSGNSYVAIKLLKDSLECRQFSQLFPVFIYPSVFCIGNTGQVLVSMSGGQTAAQLVDKLQEGFDKLAAELSPSPAQSAPVDHPPQSESQALPPTVTTPTSNDEPDNAPAGQPNLGRRVERAAELIKQRRAEREEKQFEKEKSQELQRREMGKEMAKMKEKREEQLAKDWVRERQKQKEEAKKAREEVRAKLEQDRLERQARATAMQLEKSGATPTTVPTVMSSISSSGMCRIQLKLPEGGSSVVELNITDTLAELRQRVAKEVDSSINNITLTSMYPRKELTSEYDSQSMIQLQLVPSGVILVRAKKSFISTLKREEGSSGVWGFFTYVFQLIMWFLTFIKDTLAGLFGGRANQGNREESLQPRMRERTSAFGGGVGRHGGRVEGPRLRRFRQEDYQDDSDEERRKQTYNGNSTQQQ